MLEDREKTLVYGAIGAIILILIVVIIVIWTSTFSGGKKTAEITTAINYDKGTYVEKRKEEYKNVVLRCINEDNFEETYNIINEEYLTKLGMSKDELENYLKKEKILTHPSSSTVVYCSNVSTDGEKYVYSYGYKIGNVEKKMHIIETYYDTYTVSFDQIEYPVIDSNVYDYHDSATGLDISTQVVACYEENMLYKITINNNTTEEYTFSFESPADSNLVYQNAGINHNVSLSSIVVGEGVSKFTITPGTSKTVTVSYGINLKYQDDLIQMWFYKVEKTNGETKDIGIVL